MLQILALRAILEYLLSQVRRLQLALFFRWLSNWNLLCCLHLVHARIVEIHKKRWQEYDSAVKSTNVSDQLEKSVCLPLVVDSPIRERKLYAEAVFQGKILP